MDEKYIISKMNEFMFQLADKICKWLEKKLPKLTDDWWGDLVYNNLSPLQKEQVVKNNITDLRGLDLAALLRVFDRNWFIITSSFYVNSKERYNIKDMMGIRNDWAHITPDGVSKEKVTRDVNIIISLMEAFDASMKDISPMESFLMDVEDNKAIPKDDPKEKKPISIPVAKQDTTSPTSDIGIGSIVCLASDKNVVGAVVGVVGDKFKVLINGSIQNFFREQIELQQDNKENRLLPLSRAKSALTAYQIDNPGSSNLYSLNSARIDFVPYQFRPALKMIKSDSPRLLVADDVGVGKTIEAGLILKELEARSNIDSVLIICPRPLVAERKWQLEMKRFDENFTQLDGKEFAEAMSECDRDGEWPDRHKKTVIPYSLFGEDSILGRGAKTDKKKKTIGLDELDPLPHFDLVIVDEAHNIRNSNTWAYRGVELFCRNADAVVFLSATPLQNSNKDLYTLLNLLRPDIVFDYDTFHTMAEPNAYINSLLRIVRGQKEGWREAAKKEVAGILSTSYGRDVIQHDPEFAIVYEFLEKVEITRDDKIQAIGWIEKLHSFNNIINRTRRKDIEDFCIRRTITLNVPFNSNQRDLYDALMDFESKALTILHGSQSVRFMMCTIMRQASSCIYGLAPFMNDIVSKRFSQLNEDGEMYENDISLDGDDEATLDELAGIISDRAGKLQGDDPKFDKLFEVIQEKQTEDNNRVIIFSSFRHTLRYIKKKLQEKGIRVGQVDGTVLDEERYNIRQRFLMDRDDEHALDVLLFSEVGCEGLDYQFCDTMINYDLPWNPMRIEQRIGRIDRRGQKSDTVKIYNMITDDTIDATIYDRCLSKIGVFESSIGDCSEILGDISNKILNIMFDPNLTDAERQIKIEQMADNEVMKVQEMQRLEQDEKSLYGFDLSAYMAKKDVQDAENEWISSQSINDLVNAYMNDFLGEGEYIRGKGELKNLRIAGDKRKMLLQNLKEVNIPNNNAAYKIWQAYLKSDKPQLAITFDSVCAKDNRNAAFFTQVHPFVQQAAKYETKQFPCEVGISVSDDSMPSGDYAFLIYAWKYVGLKPDIKLRAICANEAIQSQVLNYMQFASDYQFDDEEFHDKWDSMETIHYEQWKKSMNSYVSDVKNDCEFRLEQLDHSKNLRERALREIIRKANDENITKMRERQIEKLYKDYADQAAKMKEIISKADIHTNLLVRGVVHVQ